MRILLLLALPLLLIPAEETVAQALDAKAVKKGVEEYTDPDTSDAKRVSLLEVLGKAKNTDVAAGMKSVIRKENCRPHALDLALALHVREQFSAFDKFFDENPEKTTRLGLLTADKGAVKSLVKRWSSAALDSETFSALNNAFLSHGVDWDALVEIQKVSNDAEADEARRAEAAKILQFQLGLTTSDATEISLLWDGLKKEFADHGQRPPLKGMDWLAVPGWQFQSARRYGPNIRLVAEGERFGMIRKPEGLPDSFKSYGYTISMRARLDSGYEGDAGLLLSANGQTVLTGIHVQDGKWHVPGRDEGTNAPVKPGTWVTITLSIQPVTEAGHLNIACSVDGKPVVKVAVVKGTPVGFCIQCKKGSGTWGGVDYIRD